MVQIQSILLANKSFCKFVKCRCFCSFSFLPINVEPDFIFVGSAAAAAAGAALAVMFWWCVWRQKSLFHIKPYASVRGDQRSTRWNMLSWHACDPDEAETQHSIDKHSTVLGDYESSSIPEIPASGKSFGYPEYSMKAAVTPQVDASSRETTTASAAASTAFFSTRPFITETVDVRPVTWPCVGPGQQRVSIPAPLWQDVEILPDHISIAQTAAGADWILGQGSYGMVSLILEAVCS